MQRVFDPLYNGAGWFCRRAFRPELLILSSRKSSGLKALLQKKRRFRMTQ